MPCSTSVPRLDGGPQSCVPLRDWGWASSLRIFLKQSKFEVFSFENPWAAAIGLETTALLFRLDIFATNYSTMRVSVTLKACKSHRTGNGIKLVLFVGNTSVFILSSCSYEDIDENLQFEWSIGFLSEIIMSDLVGFNEKVKQKFDNCFILCLS